MTTLPDEGPIRYQAIRYAAGELFEWNVGGQGTSPRFVLRDSDICYQDIAQVVLDAIERYAGDK